MLAGNNITKSWGKKVGLAGVDIVVERGKITVLIGPSGSGKTTLIRSLSLIDEPDSGTISVDDKVYHFPLQPCARIDPPWPTVTVVFQQLFLWPHLRLRENITLPLKGKGFKDSDHRLNELIQRFDMDGFIDRYPNETSLGERQRAAIARALILEPSYILLDEITSALDVENTDVIVRQLQCLREQGIGILMVTHLLGFARRAGDRVVFLENGSVVEAGGREVFTCPKNERVQRFLSILESAS